jgi:hypothetical protein
MMYRRPLLFVACLLAGWPIAASADGNAARQQALLILRILAYDHNLPRRTVDSVVVVVVYDPAIPASLAEQALLRQGLDAVSQLRVGGMPLRVVSEAYETSEALAARIRRVRPAALYLCAGMDAAVRSVSQTARALRVLSFASSEAYVRSALSVGIIPGPRRARIVINLAASRAEGTSFDAGLLKLAEVVR